MSKALPPKLLLGALPGGRGTELYKTWLGSIAMSPDGAWLGLDHRMLTLRPITDHPEFRLVADEKEHGRVMANAIDCRGEWLATGNMDGQAHLWCARTSEAVAVVGQAGGLTTALAFSPDGRQLLQGYDNRLAIWDIGEYRAATASSTGARPIYDEQACWEHIEAVAVSPNGRTAATVGNDQRLVLWDLGALVSGLPCRPQAHKLPFSGSGLAFSPDGQHLIVGGSAVEDNATALLQVWDAQAWRPRLDLQSHSCPKPHGNSRVAVMCGPASEVFVTGEDDGSLKIWDTHSGQLQQTLPGHQNAILGLAFWADGTRLWSSGTDGLKLWDVQRGIELLTLIPFPQTEHGWIVTTPEGQVDASSDIVPLLHWQAADTQSPWPFQKFASEYRAPKLWHKILTA